MSLNRFHFAFIALTLALSAAILHAQAPAFPGLQWRLLGPFRGGRVTAVSGVAGDPATWYFGTPGGGVWKTSDAGQVWQPIFDGPGVPSVGALAVAPSDSRVVYVGTGEQMRGHGIYRSSDSGATWQSAGLEDVLFVQQIVVDPRNPDMVIVAGNSLGMGILWKPLPRWTYTGNRGIFKTTDGGRHWQKVFNDDTSIGIVDMCADPGDPRVLYAVVYRADSGEGKSAVAATSYIVKSTDEGASWKPLVQEGLPEKANKRMGVTVAPGNRGRRLYAVAEQGFYRSDDAGAHWRQSTKDPRVLGSDYFSRVFADPVNPDVVYVAETSMYRSTDGGASFTAFAGAPSGDDFHVLWIDPRNPERMISGVDQGAIISVNGGKTWSSWYNQPTGQFYHVSTDSAFPYRVYGAQQDSGTAGILSRGNDGQVMPHDWHSVGGFEYAFIAPDPVRPNLIYSGGWYGSVVRFDWNTGQIATLFEKGLKYRTGGMPPLAFSPQDPGVLYFGTQLVLITSDAGMSWKEISPDLTGYVEKAGKKDKDKNDDGPPPPTISALAPSPVQAGEIWVGTSNHLVHLTRDSGATWQSVTPAGMADPMQVLYVEPSHHDAGTAFLTAGGTRESTPPYVARTRDFGQSWQKIVSGFPANEMVRVVREDPKRKGLLYAGTDTAVFISWDEGDHWQPFSLNLPPAPVTDIAVHGDDIALSTFGRGLWVLDNVNALRDLKPEVTDADLYLFAPSTIQRVRWDNYEDTPWPAEIPAGKNPPDGAMIDYFLKAPAAGEMTLTIYDDKGAEIAHFSSEAKAEKTLPANAPEYWFAPTPTLTTRPGINRFIWDMRYPAPATLPYGYYGELLEYAEYTLADHAVPGETPRRQPMGPYVAPGQYTAELRYAGKTLRRTLTIEPDSRIHVSQSDLEEQRDLALMITRGMKASYDAFEQVEALKKTVSAAGKKEAGEKLTAKIEALEKGTKQEPGFGAINRDLGRLLFSVESADIRPSQSLHHAVREQCDALEKNLKEWKRMDEEDAGGLPVVKVSMEGCDR